LTALAVPESLAPQVEALVRERGRPRRQVARSLENLSRAKIGAAPDAWRRWLAAEGAPFLRGEVALGGGEPAEVIEASERYHSLPLDGEAIVFVIDQSRSMDEPLAGGGRRGRGRGPDERPPDDQGGQETRMQRAKTELSSVLGRLPPEATFNVIAFAGSTRCFSEEMRPAAPDVVAEAQAWVQDLDMGNSTGIYDALDLAFRIAGRTPEDGFWPSGVDTVYLLTDGRPMFERNEGDDTDRIRADVRRWNALDRIVLNTIGMGQVPLDFMRSLAEENGGQFAHETGAK
jgi:hypothetical protein